MLGKWNATFVMVKIVQLILELKKSPTRMSFGSVKVKKDAYATWFIAMNIIKIIKMLYTENAKETNKLTYNNCN